MAIDWNDFLRYRIADNSVKALLICLSIIIVAFIVRRLISTIIATVILTLFRNNSRALFKTDFKKYIINPFAQFLFWFITFAAIEQLRTPPELKYTIVFRRSIHLWMLSFSSLIVIYTFIKLLIGVQRFITIVWMHNSKEQGKKDSYQLLSVIGDLITIILVIIGVLLALKISFKVKIDSFITNLSLVTAALALAAKESLENIIASFIIFLDKPFVIGDFVKLTNVSGTVESIGLRSTRLRTLDKSLITVPNKQMVDSILDNVTYGTHRRYTETLELSLSTSINDINRLIDKIKNFLIGNFDKGIENPYVFLKQTGGSGHFIYVEFLVNNTIHPTLREYYEMVDYANRHIVDIVSKENIAYSQASSTVVNIMQPADNSNFSPNSDNPDEP